jgi:signal transduction histidine kinase
VQYRAFAYRAFDADLVVNLNTLSKAFEEQLRESRGSVAGSGDLAPLVLQRASSTTLDDFRLSGMFAEMRQGERGERLLGRIPDGSPRSIAADAGQWTRIAGSEMPVVAAFGPLYRGAGRGYTYPGFPIRVSIAVAGELAPLEAALESVRRSLFQLGIAGLGLALAGGYWLATRTLRPIATLTEQAGRMAALPTSDDPHRLAIANSEDELGRLAATFNQLLERIDASARQVRAFVADAAHEMKTPVAIVRTESELALADRPSVEEMRRALGAIASESERLSQLVSDLTLLAEGQTLEHPLERRLVDLDELVEDVVASLRPIAAARGVTVKVTLAESAEYRGDERLLRRVTINLLENAIKFSPPRTEILVQVSRKPDGFALDFLDEAETLTEEERERVFDRFYRTRAARSGGATGSGLGLAIVQWAVRLHGGRVDVEPKVPRGNRFRVVLPRAG